MSVAQPAVAFREANYLSKTGALIAKDVRIEMRSRDTLPPMLAFSLIVSLLLAFSLPGESGTMEPRVPVLGAVPLADVLAGFLWITVLFAGLIAFARTFEVERRDGALDALLLVPVDRSAIFVAKAVANLLYIVVSEILLVPFFVLMFDIPTGNLPTLLVVALLVDVGFVMVGTLFASLAAQTRSRELMLPVLALPALVPVFIAAVELTSDLFLGAGLDEVAARGWFGILIAFDVIFTTAGVLAFEYALES